MAGRELRRWSDSAMTLFLILFVSVGLLLIFMAIPLARRRVKPNALYGLRLPATFADDWVWYEANAKSGRDILLLGAGEIIAAVALYQIPGLSAVDYAVANGSIVGIGTLVMAVVGWWRANSLLEERRRSK